jgi:pimeloyl-ACP methyl ester carboxylesterase
METAKRKAAQWGADAALVGKYLLGTPVDLLATILVAVPTFPLLVLCDSSHALRPRDSAPLTVLVHGTNASPLQFLAACWYLRRHRIPYYCAAYNSRQSVAESVHEVQVHVEAELRRRHQPGIALIGHSQGGLIARLVARKLQRVPGIPPVKLCVTLNAPQRGARLAHARNWISTRLGLGVAQAYADMCQGSAFVQEYCDGCMDEGFPALEVSGRLDFVRESESVLGTTATGVPPLLYRSWFGHNFSSVNPVLWNTCICPLLLTLDV